MPDEGNCREAKKLANYRLRFCGDDGPPIVNKDLVGRLRQAPGWQKLGVGTYGIAYLCHDPLQRNENLVLKSFHTSDAQMELFNEVFGLWYLRDEPHVQRLVGVCLETMEIVSLYAGHSLREVLGMDSFTTQEKVQALRQTLETMERLHEKGLCHNDIKADNICVSRTQTGLVNAAIIDFGLCSRIDENNEDCKNVLPPFPTMKGSPLENEISNLGALCLNAPWLRNPPDLEAFKNVNQWAMQACKWDPKERPSLREGITLFRLLEQFLNPPPDLRPSLQGGPDALDELDGRLRAPGTKKRPREEEEAEGEDEEGNNTPSLQSLHEPQHLGSFRPRKRPREGEDSSQPRDKRRHLQPSQGRKERPRALRRRR